MLNFLEEFGRELKIGREFGRVKLQLRLKLVVYGYSDIRSGILEILTERT